MPALHHAFMRALWARRALLGAQQLRTTAPFFVRPPASAAASSAISRRTLRASAIMAPFSGAPIGAHRGCGENILWHASEPQPLPPPYRENTLRSFRQAIADGCAFIEFDVQVTADGVPVVWHDNYVVYGEAYNPVSKLISELTLAEFRALAPINQLDTDVLGASPDRSTIESASPDGGSPEGSLYGSSPPSSVSSSRLLRQLRNGLPAVAYEPTLRAWDVTEDDALPTLGEVLAGLPLSVPLDIEIKMATPDSLAVTPPEEVSRMLGAILAEVDAAEQAAGTRPLIFSSFDPDICLELKRRRPDFNVYFLSGGGEYPHADQRRTSVGAAIQVAASGGLQGVILNTAALARQQDCVALAAAEGLSVMSYGRPNNSPAWVKQQLALGLQGVIVDDVAGVVAGLASSAAADDAYGQGLAATGTAS